MDDYTLNLYSSCAFNCLYCYIRGSKYGSNLESSLSVKINALEVLEKQLHNRARKGQYGIVVLSSATDPYLKIEKQYELTREALKLMLRYRFPVHMITKSDLIVRDFDLLQEIDATALLPDDLKNRLGRGAILSFSFSTLDDRVGAIFEPGAPSPSIRLQTVKKAKAAGFLSGVSLMPLLPFISDTGENLHRMFSTFKTAGVDYLMPATLTLFGQGRADSKTLVLNAIKKHYPDLEKRYHRYFDQSNEMPAFYQKAFYQKMKELSREYVLPDRILS